MNLTTTIVVYNAIVISTLLYGYKTWTLYWCDIPKSNTFTSKSVVQSCTSKGIIIMWPTKKSEKKPTDKTSNCWSWITVFDGQDMWQEWKSQDFQIKSYLTFLLFKDTRTKIQEPRYKNQLKQHWKPLECKSFETQAWDCTNSWYFIIIGSKTLKPPED